MGAPAWTIVRQWRPVDGHVSTLVRIAGGTHIQVYAPAAHSTGDELTALIESAIAQRRPPIDPHLWEE